MKLTAKEVILVLSAIHTDIIEKAEKRDECYDDIKALYSAISKISGVEVTN